MKFRPIRDMMESELARWKLLRRVAAISYLLLNSGYMIYRFTIINPHSLVLSWAYFVAETFQFILGITYIYTTWSYRRRKRLPAPNGLNVEVWVPVYREPLDVIRRTLKAAMQIDYPHITRVFDDGRRNEVRQIAAELGVQYFSRQENRDAKAGNLNFALEESTAEFIMVFDADHIALPSALDDLLGYFSDDDVALVQTPQDYYNSDAFQYFNSKRRGGIWHDQSSFYLFGLPAMDHDGSATCVGTGVVYRRTALNEIGGIPTATATEDIHTSLRLMKAGWKTVFHTEPVAYGIAASNLEEYYTTRHRWAHGNLHVLSLEGIPFTKGLTWRQRLHHLALGLIYLEGWQQLLLMLIPVLALLTGWQPFVITPLNVLIVLCYPLLSIALLQELGSGYSRIWANEIFSMARWPVHLISVLGLLRRKILWKTSSKLLQTQTTLSRVLPQLSIFLLSGVGLGVAVRILAAHFDRGILLSGHVASMTTALDEGYTVDILVVAGGWALYNMIRVGVFLKRAWHRSGIADEHYRFPITMPIELSSRDKTAWYQTEWIAENALRIRLTNTDTRPTAGERMMFSLTLPTGVVQGEVSISHFRSTRTSSMGMECEMEIENAESRQRLVDALFAVFWYRDLRANRPVFLTPMKWLARLLTGHAFERYAILDHFALLKSSNGDRHFAIIHDGEDTPLLSAFDPLPIGDTYRLHEFADSWREKAIRIERIDNDACGQRIGGEGRASTRYAYSQFPPCD